MCVAGLQLMKKVKDEGLGFIKSNFWVTESEESTLGKLEKIEHVGENWGWSIFSNHENIEVHLRNANLGQRVLKESRALPQYLQQEWCPSQPSPVSPSWGRVSGNANAGESLLHAFDILYTLHADQPHHDQCYLNQHFLRAGRVTEERPKISPKLPKWEQLAPNDYQDISDLKF